MSVQTGTMPPPATTFHFHAGSGAGTGNPQPPHFRGYTPTVYNGKPTMNQEEYDGKRLRKSSMRKTVDYNCSVMKYLEDRVWQRGAIDRPTLQPDVLFYPELHPPAGYTDNPINAVTTRFVRTATNKMRCPIFCLGWTPEGRRLITGASSGEFTLWNGLTFNFETILQAHDSPVRTMVWSRNDQWMVTGDHGGYIKYWQMNMNNVKMFQAHKDPVRGISFSPSDHKLATCSDDGTVRIWDFIRCYEEKVLRGHGADVKCLDWHPHKGLVVSGSKDNQQPVRLWDPKSGQSLATLHAHKSTVMDLSFNRNGNWLLTASRDHLIKIFDIRNLGAEMQVFRGHKKEAASVSWHPIHETLFSSGGSDGAMMFWNVGCDKEVGCIDQAHDSLIWSMSWHPLGHVLASGSNDHTTKFWTRNRPGDTMQDKYNLNISEPAEAVPTVKPGTDESGLTEESAAESADADALLIPGMGPDDRVEPPPGEPDGERGEDDPRPTELHADGRRFPSRRPHWRFANHWNERWNQDFDQPGGDRGGRGWRGRGRPDWRGRGRGAFRDRDRDDRRDNKDDRKDDKDGDGSGERRGRWPDRDGSRDSSRDGSRDGPGDGPRDDSREGSRDSGGPERKSGDDQMARDMDLRPDGSGRDFRGGRGATRGRCHADEPPGGGRDWARDGDEKMDVSAQLDETNGHSDGPSPSDGLRRGARGTFRGGDRGRFRDGTDRGVFRDQGRGGGFRDQGRGGFRDRGGFGRPEGDRGPGGFGNPGGDADGFGRPEGDRGRGGFGRLEGDRDGFGRPEGDRGGFGRPEGDRGGFGRPEGDRGRGGFGRPEGDRGGFGRSVGDRGGFGRPEGDRGGFGRPEGDQSGFGRPNGDRGGPPGLKGERDDTMLDRPPPSGQPGGEWRDGWRGRGGDPGWRGGGADEAKGGFHGGRGGWRGGDDQDEGGWRGGSGGNFRGRGSFREDERGGWRTRGRVRGPGPRRGRGDLY